ncbi:uncharacterized protein CTRU02_205031 [Colletotrichum truncatum]|uniref:Uncharacterized protein n=1 Tax=Colletotrichum truncatum TaxID=5467 RepID=A0ACC3Z2V7_COLTU
MGSLVMQQQQQQQQQQQHNPAKNARQRASERPREGLPSS